MKKLSAEDFLGKLWPRVLLRDETLELRAKRRKDNKIRREFLRSIPDFLKSANKYGEGWDIYFGVATRLNQGGKKSDCFRVQCVWIDLDKPKLPDFNPKPDLIVHSGGGYHVYWLLKDPIFLRTGKWSEVEAVNRALCRRYMADIGSLDVSRILRVPEFHNWKYNPPTKVEAYAL